MADYLIRRHGFARLPDYFRGLGTGLDRFEGFQRGFGQTLEEFEREVLNHLSPVPH
jgi:hypothetical protein